jgi:hypothetical protein
MVETDPHNKQKEPLSPLDSEADYDLYCDKVLREVDTEQNPGEIDATAQNLLFLARKHHALGQAERF